MKHFLLILFLMINSVQANLILNVHDQNKELLKTLPVDRVVKIFSLGSSTCSGFKLKNDLVLTARHCIDLKGKENQRIQVQDLKQEEKLRVEEYVVHKVHKTDDLALLRKKSHNPDIKLQSEEISTSGLLRKGDKVYILGTNGFDALQFLQVRSLTVFSRLLFQGGSIIHGSSLYIKGGTSGSAVFTNDGQLVGVLAIGEGNDMSGFAPIDGLRYGMVTLKEYQQENKIKPNLMWFFR
jgi:S1-C subfamily serine protease